MQELNLGWFLLFGFSAGWLAGIIIGERGFGLVGSLIVGVMGAYLGGYLFRVAGWDYDSITGSFITTLAGAIMILVLVKMLRRF